MSAMSSALARRIGCCGSTSESFAGYVHQAPIQALCVRWINLIVATYSMIPATRRPRRGARVTATSLTRPRLGERSSFSTIFRPRPPDGLAPARLRRRGRR